MAIDAPPQGYERKVDIRGPIRLGPELHYRSVATRLGEVRIDAAGGRWLVDAAGAKRASELDPADHVALGWGDDVGLVSVGADRYVRVAREPTGAWARVSALPAELELGSVRVHRGGLSARKGDRLTISTNLRDWVPAPFFDDRAPIDMLIGHDGGGIGLFAPQAIATTRDAGRSWSPIADAGVIARFLLQAPDGSVLVGPGGERDPFLRAWDGKSALGRWTAHGLQVDYDNNRVQPSVADGPSSWSIDLAAPMPQRYGSLVGDLVKGSGALDRDDVLVLSTTDHARKEVDPTRVLVGTGSLGRGLTWKPLELPPGVCIEGERRAALFDGTQAFACSKVLVVNVAGKSPLVLQLPWEAGAVAFHGARRVLVARGPSAAPGEQSELEVLGLSLDSPGELQKVAVDKPKHSGSLRFVTAALPGERDVPLWLVSSAFRKSPLAWRLASSGFVHEGELDENASVLGLAPDGALVFVAGSTLTHLLAGKRAKSDIGFQAFPLGWMPSLRKGRALLMSGSVQLRETSDAGKSWRPVPLPAFGVRVWNVQHTPAIACGASRCQFGDDIVREGWGSAPEQEAVPTSGAVAPADAPKASGAKTIVSCRAHDPFTPSSAPGELQKIHPGVRGAVWTGFSVDSRAGESWVVHGAKEGSVASRRLKLQHHGSTQIVGTLVGRFGPEGNHPRTLVEWQSEAQGQTWESRRKNDGGLRLDLVGASLNAPNGVALLDTAAQELLWLTAAGSTKARRWPGVLTGRSQPTGSFLEAKDGVWHALFWPADLDRDDSAAPWLSPLQGQPTGLSYRPFPTTHGWRQVATLVAIAPDESWRSRTFVPETTGGMETGTALVTHRDQTALASVEEVPGGGAELRVRVLDGDLRPGKAVTLASAPAGKLLRIGACEADGEGSPLLIAAREPVSFVVAGQTLRGHLVRRVMVGPSSACVRNTVLAKFDVREESSPERLYASPQSTRVSLVVLGGAGKAPGVAMLRGGVKGVSCDLGPVLD